MSEMGPTPEQMGIKPEGVVVQKTEQVATPSAEEEKNLEIVMNKYDLGKAIGFRLALDKGEGENVSQTQVALINEMREKGIISFPEDEKTALGYLRSQDEVKKFVELAQKYPGEVGFGGSHGDSRLWLVEDQQDSERLPVVATSTATNAAARVVYGGLGTKLDQLTVDNIFTHRYATFGEPVEGADLVQGAKGTWLEKRQLADAGLPEVFDPAGMSEEAKMVYSKLAQEKLTTREVVLANAAAMAVLSIDVNGFSKKIQGYTDEKDFGKAEEYLETVVTFLTRLENNINETVKEQNPQAEALMFEWRGDAGGAAVPAEYADLLPAAFEKSLVDSKGKIAAKAVILGAGELHMQKSSVGAHIGSVLDGQIGESEKQMKVKMAQTGSASALFIVGAGDMRTYGWSGEREATPPTV